MKMKYMSKGSLNKPFVVFFQIDNSRTTKEQFHSDPAFILNVLTKYYGPQYRRQRSSLTE